MDIFLPLAEAIRDQLIAAKFQRPALIEQPIDGLREDEELKQLRVDVLIGDKNCRPMSRVGQENIVRLDVCVRQTINAPRNSREERQQIGGLLNYVAVLDEYLSAHDNRRPPNATWAGWQNSETIIPYSTKLLRENRLFYSLFRLTYFVASVPQEDAP